MTENEQTSESRPVCSFDGCGYPVRFLVRWNLQSMKVCREHGKQYLGRRGHEVDELTIDGEVRNSCD